MTMVTETTTEKIGKLPDDLHTSLKEDFSDFLTNTQEARDISNKCRDYVDGNQWSELELEKLRKRAQAPVVVNRLKPKLNGLLGLIVKRVSEPRAFPRNQSLEDQMSAEALTDGLVFVADNNNLNQLRLEAADNFFCEGYCAAMITEKVLPDNTLDVNVSHIPWERIFFDPYSIKADFSDARYKGFVVWMDEEDIYETFGEVDSSILVNTIPTDEMYLDEKWFKSTGRKKRYLVVTHYFKLKGKWQIAIYTGGGFLLEPTDSPYLNEHGQPMCPIELTHAYIKRDGSRGGELESFLDLQDEVNHRRSKALFLNSQRQTFGNRGAIKDVQRVKAELAKPNGHVELNVGEFGKDFGILPTNDMAQAQFQLLIEAKQEIDAQSYNAQLAGDRQQGNLSGKAISRLQNAGLIELERLMQQFSDWEKRIYNQIWYRIRQYWTQEKWLRLTDDESKLRWVGFNIPITLKQYLEELAVDDSQPFEMKLGASAKLVELEKSNPEELNQVIKIKNNVAELLVDVTLDQVSDSINSDEEQFMAIMEYGLANQFDLIDILELSTIRNKNKLIDKIKARRAQCTSPDPQSEYLMAKAAEAMAATKVKEADANQKYLESQLLQANPPVAFKGTIST